MQDFDKRQKSKFTIMVVLTAVYLSLIIIFALFDINDMKQLKPNEWGDFFAGFFAPLAFLWLIFGYYQQGQELRLQAQEFANFVEEQKRLNEIHEYGIHSKRIEIKPLLVYKYGHYVYRIYDQMDDNPPFEGICFNFLIENHGNIAKNIKISGRELNLEVIKIDTDNKEWIRFYYPEKVEKDFYEYQGRTLKLELAVNYSDNTGYQYTDNLLVRIDDFVGQAVDQEIAMKVINLSA